MIRNLGRLFALATGLIVWLGVIPAQAHGLHTHVECVEAVTVTFVWDNGNPITYEAYEILAPYRETPFAVGQTDGRGRVVFRPDISGNWQVKVWTEDGHGKTIDVAVDDDLAAPTTLESSAPGMIHKMTTGVAILFGLFGLWALAHTRRKK